MNTYKSIDVHEGHIVTISGDTLKKAIENNWKSDILKTITGNGAGTHVLSAILHPSNPQATRGHKTFASLIIKALGHDLAHKKQDGTIYTTRYDFVGDKISDVGYHEFKIGK